MKNYITNILTFLMLLSSVQVMAQQESDKDLMEMSIEELLEVEVYSVSKKKESLFEAPLSSSIITGKQIQQAGVTNIPEALRLVPGLIVRETTNGNYDVHLRGFDNLNRYSDASTGGNQITLAMIDGRPVFNNNIGGVFWESLPVDIIDIERIEVVRGPAAALYGPNAVSGVINIITKSREEEGYYTDAQINYGVQEGFNPATTTAGLRVGYKASEKLNLTLSGNFQNRKRLDDQYFSYFDNEYVILDSVKSTYGLNEGEPLSAEQQDYAFPNGSNESLQKLGTNLFIDYKANDWLSFNGQVGYQNASSQRVFRQNPYTPLSVLSLESFYANLQVKASDLTARFSFTNGNDDLNSVPFFLPSGDSIMIAYTYENADINLEYSWSPMQNLSIVPGVSYQRSTYSDNNLDDEPNQLGLLNGRKTLFNLSASLRGDYQPIEDLRIIAAARADRFTKPEKVYISYEFATAYSLNENNFLRAVISRSNSGAFMGQTFIDLSQEYTVQTPFGGFNGIADFNGNQNLELFQLQLFEVGYRSRLMSNLEIDLELFHQRSQNSNEIVDDEIPSQYFAPISNVQIFKNLPLEASQFGATLGLNYLPSNELQIRPFVTVQETTTTGLPTGYNTPERNPLNNIFTTTEEENIQTPTIYGGLIVNYQPTEKWNINLNSYYLDAHTQFNEYDRSNTDSSAGEIETNLINNLNIMYRATDFLAINFNARNLANNQNREYYGADRKGYVLMGGLSLSL